MEECSNDFDATRSTGYLCAATVKNFEQVGPNKFGIRLLLFIFLVCVLKIKLSCVEFRKVTLLK